MQLRLTGALLLCLLIFISPIPSESHNITRILAKFPEFSTFNHYLTLTHLADDINTRQTITVCVVDNSAMLDLIAKSLPIASVKNVLSLHVLLDYFGAKKLHQLTTGTALAATMFQATGAAFGSSGFVNITDLKGGKVAFAPQDISGHLPSTFVKSIEEIPYNISVIHICTLLPSPTAEAASQFNFTSLMSSHGCKTFADNLLGSDAYKTFEDNIGGGLTVFCPIDDAFKSFLPRFRNLTVAGKRALLEFHGVPIYQSMAMLKLNNGQMNTLATDGANKYAFTVQNDGEQVTVKTRLVAARLIGTLIDQLPLMIFTIDKVLLPKELFKGALAPTPAPAPVPDAPESAKKKAAPAPVDSPADAPDGDVTDQTAADENDLLLWV